MFLVLADSRLVKPLRSWGAESRRGDGAVCVSVCGRESKWNRLTLCWSSRHLDFRSASSSVRFWISAARNAAPPYVSPFNIDVLSPYTSSVNLSKTPKGSPVWKHYCCSFLLLSFYEPSPSFCLHFPSLLPSHPRLFFSLHNLTFPIPPPSSPFSSLYNSRYRMASEHRLVNYTGLSVGKQACASSCKTETCWQASVTLYKMIVQYAGWGRFEQVHCPAISENHMQYQQRWNAMAYLSGVDTLVKRITGDFFFLLQKCKVSPFHNGIVGGGM